MYRKRQPQLREVNNKPRKYMAVGVLNALNEEMEDFIPNPG
jgi:hypothetical protein